MGGFLKLLLNWSEVWATLIPLSILLFRPRQPRFLKPIIIYLLVIALFINLTRNIISEYYEYLPGWMESNTPLYNAHSIIRFICFLLLFYNAKAIFFYPVEENIAFFFSGDNNHQLQFCGKFW